MTNCPKNIQDLFDFLVTNKKYNKKVQEEDIRRTLASYDTVEERALRLLYEIVNTQSQPKLDPIAKFFQHVRERSDALSNYAGFSAFLGVELDQKEGLFEALRSQEGWGDKTAALFVRNLAVIAATPELSQMFWIDINRVNKKPIRLPVDKVIEAIFLHLRIRDEDPLHRVKGFKAINRYLSDELKYEREDMLIWDDLWFWGFITQRSKAIKLEDGVADKTQADSKAQQRQYGWNAAKYWSIFTAPKDEETIIKIEGLANDFLRITEAPVSPAK